MSRRLSSPSPLSEGCFLRIVFQIEFRITLTPLDDFSADSVKENDRAFIVKTEGRSWGFAYVKPRTEKKLLAKLLAFGVPCYLPLLKKMRVHHRAKVLSEIPMFPSYVFLCSDALSVTQIKRQNEVIELTMMDGEAENDFIKELNLVRKCEILSEKRKVVVNPGLQPGQTVLIKSGPLKNSEVIVVRRVNEVVMIVNLHILGRNCECKIGADELRSIE